MKGGHTQMCFIEVQQFSSEVRNPLITKDDTEICPTDLDDPSISAPAHASVTLIYCLP